MGEWRRWGLELFLVCFAVADGASVLLSDEPRRALVAALSMASVLVLCGRRQAPLTVTVAAFLILMVGTALSPTSTGVQFLGMVVAFVVAGIVNRGRDVLVAALVGLCLIAFGTLVLDTGLGWSDFWLSAAFCEGVLVAGWLLTRRSHQVEQLRSHATLVEERERQRSREALSEERARIARELHDVVSHGLSVVIVQAQAARSTLDDAGDGDGAAAAADLERRLVAVEGTARDALAEMRRMLGLLQLDEVQQSSPEPPSPGLGSLGDLVERARRAGVPVEARLPGPGAVLGGGMELAIYRIVQEALTNVVKHAPDAATTVEVDVGPAAVELVVRNDASGAPRWTPAAEPGGRGLVGMRERVSMYDGRLEVGASASGGFEVHAVIPIDARAVREVGA